MSKDYKELEKTLLDEIEKDTPETMYRSIANSEINRRYKLAIESIVKYNNKTMSYKALLHGDAGGWAYVPVLESDSSLERFTKAVAAVRREYFGHDYDEKIFRNLKKEIANIRAETEFRDIKVSPDKN